MIFLNKKQILAYQKINGVSTTSFSDETVRIGNLRGVEVQCVCFCGKEKTVKFYTALLLKPYTCISCNVSGSKNPFYGKAHSHKTKEIISKKAKDRDTSGERNPFYGKHHSEETKTIWSNNPNRRINGERNPFYGKHHSEETRQVLSKKHKLWASNNIKLLKSNGLKTAARQRFRKTKPERCVESFLLENQIVFQYNKILTGVGQFDFFISPNILLEVHGDYWHCNPKIYPDGPINDRQKYKLARDIEKKHAAEQLGYKLLYIWEYDINQNNYDNLQELLNAN